MPVGGEEQTGERERGEIEREGEVDSGLTSISLAVGTVCILLNVAIDSASISS